MSQEDPMKGPAHTPGQDLSKGQDISDWSENIHDLIQQMHKRKFVQFRDTGAWMPAANVYEIETTYIICVDLAGMTKENVAVHCNDDRHLVLAGNRPQPPVADSDTTPSMLVLEIDEGPFRREIELPRPFDVEQVAARYDKGYLWITLPKTTS